MPDAKTVRAYKASLLKFLSFLDGMQHPRHYKAMDECLIMNFIKASDINHAVTKVMGQ
jgi:hypothetical protein